MHHVQLPTTRPGRPATGWHCFTWAGAYAVTTLILQLLGPTMPGWPLPVRTLAISALMVVALTWLVIPSMTRLFRGWPAP